MKKIDEPELAYLNMLLLQQREAQIKLQGYLGFLEHKYDLAQGDVINPTTGLVFNRKPEIGNGLPVTPDFNSDKDK